MPLFCMDILIYVGAKQVLIFLTLLDSGCSSKHLMIKLIRILKTKEDYVMEWHNQAGDITTNLKVKIDFTWPEFSATNILMWECHVDDFNKVRYDIILGRYLLT